MNDCITLVHSELTRLSILSTWVDPSTMWHNVLIPCKTCDINRSPPHKKCNGWQLGFRDHQALVLVPSEIKKRSVQLAIEGRFNVTRGAGKWTAWQRAPIRESSAAFVLRDAESNHVLTRQHLDLANHGQPGPAWHVQLGGVGGGDDKGWLKLVANLRWPAVPAEFMLIVDLGLYLFHNSAWIELQRSSPWRAFVQQSEDLILPHYIEALNDYWNRRNSASSWLAAQCNATGTLRSVPS